jgi:sugar-phosphatase
MPSDSPVRAVLFDLDGTLVDSEVHTDTAIRVIAERHGVAGFALPPAETRGRTWAHIAGAMKARAGITAETGALADELLDYWTGIAADVTPVPGAPEAVRAAARRMKLGVVSSSPRSVIDSFLGKLGVEDCIDPRARIGSDAVRTGKPEPEGFLRAARALETDPAYTLVCEDSEAGLRAARAAGMRSLFVTCCAADVPENRPLASASCTDYRCLPPGFWDALADGSLELSGQAYA